MKNKLVNFVEEKYLNKNIPFLRSGYLVEVKIWVVESSRKRLQNFIGIIISIKNKGLNTSITLRRFSYGEGIEKIFFIHSPIIHSILIKKKNFFNKSKLYFLRNKNKFYVK